MRSTILHRPGDIRLTELPTPSIRRPTDALLRVVASCICGSDLWPYRGQDDVEEPRPIGHEVIGVVEAVGEDVASFRPGDFVVVPFCQCDNTCAHCRAGVQSACVDLAITHGGQSEYVVVQHADGSLVATPEPPPDELLPGLLSLADVFPTGWHCAVSANVRRDDTVVVVGDGAVGLSAVLAASHLGAERIVVMSRHASRQAVATRFGATDIVAERGREGGAIVKELTSGIGADAVMECVGTGDSMDLAVNVARPGATVGFVGVPHGVVLPVSRMFGKNVGLAGGMAPVRRYLPTLLDLVWREEIDPGAVFDTVLPLADVATGYQLMDERKAIKVMLRP